MTASAANERRNAVEIAVAEVLDGLFPEDLNALLDKYRNMEALSATLTERAHRVLDKLESSSEPARPEKYQRVVAACLTRSRNQVSVARNTNNATKKFQHYRLLPELPIGLLVRTDRHLSPTWTPELLMHSDHVRRTITAVRPDMEPELILNLVVPATIAAVRPDVLSRPFDVDVTMAVAGTVLEVLDRGADLAAAYRVLGRRTAVGTKLPVIGNADFLVRIAAYRVAIDERSGGDMTAPFDELERAVAELAGVLGEAMRHPAGGRNRRGQDEPDVVTAFGKFARYLGPVSGPVTRDAVRAVHAVLNYRIGLVEPSTETTIDDADTRADPAEGNRADACHFADVEHHVGWLVSALFAGTDPIEQRCLLHWLAGRTVPNEQKNLPLMVRRLRLATTRLDEEPTSRPTRPTGITAHQFKALVTRLATDVKPGEIKGNPRSDARRVTLATLPPLWTSREGAIRHVTSHLRVLMENPDKADRDAEIIARHGVRAPVQFVDKSAARLREPCCPDAGDDGRPAPSSPPRPPVPDTETCPHRPWGEIGYVENYRSLADAAECTDETARKRTDRYSGPWRELLLP